MYEQRLPQIPLGIDSLYLDKIYVTGLYGTQSDTIIWQYAYDNFKRVIALEDITPVNPSLPTSTLYAYYYNSLDTLPYKSVYINNIPVRKDTLVTYFTYNNSGKRIKDSIYHFIYSEDFTPPIYAIIRAVKKYEYGTNAIYSESADSLIYQENGQVSIANTRDTALLDANGNIINVRSYDINTNELIHSSELTYDNQPSPFTRLSNFNTFPILPNSELIGYTWAYPQKNNLLSLKDFYTTENITQLLGFNEYTFSNNSYPKQFFLYDGAAQQSAAKIIFAYKAL